MFRLLARNVGTVSQSLKSQCWRSFRFCVDGVKESRHLQLLYLPVIHKGNQRVFSSPAWHKPLGNVPMPRKNNPETKLSEIVAVEDVVGRHSLIGLDSLHDACSAPEVFQALDELGRSLNEVHIARAMTKLVEVQSSVPDTVEESRALALCQDHKNFVHLCHLALRHATTMDSNQFTDVLKAVIGLKVPQSSVMVQTLLASAEQRLNQFNCDELAKFAGILLHLQETDQRVHALLQAVTILVPNLIATCNNALTLNRLLHNVGKQLDRRTHVKIALRLISILKTKLHVEEEQTVLDAAEAIIAFNSIGYHNAQIMDEACEIIINHIEYLPPTKLMLTLHSLSGLRYYSPGLLEKAGDLIADQVDTFTIYHLSRILRTYSSQRFLHKKLLNSVANSVSSRPLDQVSIVAFIGILSPFAKFQHFPPSLSSDASFFNLVAAAAESQLARCQPGSDLDCSQLVQLVALLAMCGSYSPRMVQTALSRMCYEPVLADLKTLPYLRTLYTIITADMPNLAACPLSGTDSTELSHALDRMNKETRVPRIRRNDAFKKSVAKILKETDNLKYSMATDVLISNGYTVDFVVSDTRKGTPPTAIDLTRDVLYCANALNRPLGHGVIKGRHLEAMGYKYHVMRNVDWVALGSHEEKTEYIQRVLSSSH